MEIPKKENYDMDFIQSLITNALEESINIDFKAGEALPKIDAKKRKLRMFQLLLIQAEG